MSTAGLIGGCSETWKAPRTKTHRTQVTVLANDMTAVGLVRQGEAVQKSEKVAAHINSRSQLLRRLIQTFAT